jgi:hypothetical protein
MTTTSPRPTTLSRCVTCKHFKVNHSTRRTGSRPRRCLVDGCTCPGYVDEKTAAVAIRRAARGATTWEQTRLFDLEDEG